MKRPRAMALLLGVLLLRSVPASWAADAVTRLLDLPLPQSLELCGEPVPLDREDTWERLDTELVAIVGSPVTTALWIKRIPRYLPGIEAKIRERGLPDDLKYVSLVESNLRASSISRAGAVGPWQFIRSTGELSGLEQNEWKDERRDWDEATRAALDHLEGLREEFGSWSLALAAYNAGAARVSSALKAQAETDFYGLRLPRETERYVFRVLAAKLVVENPQAYGIDTEGTRHYPPLETEEISVNVTRGRIPVAAVAHAAGVSYRWLAELNPWLRDEELPRGTHRIRVPVGAVAGFSEALAGWEAANPEPRTVYYRVRAGDTLTAIAQQHNVRLEDLCSWNRLSLRSVIRPGQKLVLFTLE